MPCATLLTLRNGDIDPTGKSFPDQTNKAAEIE
jgi:hypothetical protein